MALRDPRDAFAALRRLPGGDAVLDAIAAVPNAWVVGGAPRDALLGRAARELDVVVEGDPRELLAALGGEVRAHERFGVWTVSLPEGGAVDVVRARGERYAEPGALPEVEPAGLAEDLARRDVTVNTIALREVGTACGEVELRSVPGALEDLEAGVLRALHPASFEDDPTRLWRVARYGARLAFAPDDATRAAAAAADPWRISSPVRMGNEVRLALREPDPLAVLRAAHLLHPGLLPARFDLDPRGLGESLDLLPEGEGDPGLVVLGACAGPTDLPALLGWLDALGFPADDRDVVAAGSRAAVLHPLRVATTNSAIARAARGAPAEVVALAGGEGARRWFGGLRDVRLEIDGRDLLAAGVPAGPDLGRRLQRALDRKLDEGIAGRDAELATALE